MVEKRICSLIQNGWKCLLEIQGNEDQLMELMERLSQISSVESYCLEQGMKLLALVCDELTNSQQYQSEEYWNKFEKSYYVCKLIERMCQEEKKGKASIFQQKWFKDIEKLYSLATMNPKIPFLLASYIVQIYSYLQ